MDKFRLVIEGVRLRGTSSWGFRVGSQHPDQAMRWVANWMPSQAWASTSIEEQLQVVDDMWWSLVKYHVGVQEQLPF